MRIIEKKIIIYFKENTIHSDTTDCVPSYTQGNLQPRLFHAAAECGRAARQSVSEFPDSKFDRISRLLYG